MPRPMSPPLILSLFIFAVSHCGEMGPNRNLEPREGVGIQPIEMYQPDQGSGVGSLTCRENGSNS